jgi:hypothetical protein
MIRSTPTSAIFFKVERWARNDLHIEAMLHAGTNIEKAAPFSTRSPCNDRGGAIPSGSGHMCFG